MTKSQFGEWLAGFLFSNLNVLKDTDALADRVLEAARSVPVQEPERYTYKVNVVADTPYQSLRDPALFNNLVGTTLNGEPVDFSDPDKFT